MRDKRMGGGASDNGAPTPSPEMSRLRKLLFIAALVLVTAPSFDSLSGHMEWLETTPSYAALVAAAVVFWLEVARTARATWNWTRVMALKPVDGMIKFFINRAWTLRKADEEGGTSVGAAGTARTGVKAAEVTVVALVHGQGGPAEPAAPAAVTESAESDGT